MAAATDPDQLRSFDCCLQGGHGGPAWLVLQAHRYEMAGVALGLVRKRVLGDERGPFRRRAHEEGGAQPEALLGLRLKPSLDYWARQAVVIEDDIAALQERAGAGEAQLLKKRPQRG